MKAIHSISLNTPSGKKSISVYTCNILDFDQPIDILTTSAFYRSYEPTPRTLFEALDSTGISVCRLADAPEFDLRVPCNIWLSSEIHDSSLAIRRIGCIEMSPYTWNREAWHSVENDMLVSIKAYFQMLDIAASYDVPMETVALPLLGAGSQMISSDLTIIPILNECIQFLKRNGSVKHIYIIDFNAVNAYKFALALEKSYSIYQDRTTTPTSAASLSRETAIAFLSYSSKDKEVADALCAKLEANGLKVWYAPRDIFSNDYASAIVNAIQKCTHFIVILSHNSMDSEHVLNEIDLAFQEKKRIQFLPLRIDELTITPAAFSYYLARQHWTDACPPVEQKLNEFTSRILETLPSSPLQ